jgi:hypothetical protein
MESLPYIKIYFFQNTYSIEIKMFCLWLKFSLIINIFLGRYAKNWIFPKNNIYMFAKLFDLTYFDCTHAIFLQAQSGLPLESTASSPESTGCCHPPHWHSKSHSWHLGRGKGIPSQGTTSPLPVRYSAYD